MLAPSRYRFGPLLEGDTRTRFRLWAPGADRVLLCTEGAPDIMMSPTERGWYEADVECGPGTRYRFRIGEISVPDPASRAQAADVHSASIVMDDRYSWKHEDWRGRPWEEVVLYELHAGIMGGFSGVQQHLTRLADIGITAIELMPIADFPGARNWGYDGVLPFAPDRAYGTPDELRALIDAAHERGLMVFLDVVYNHFGPDGNYLPTYAPQFFDQTKHTPWGAAINFAQPEVRRFFIENALYWLADFRFDGLRFDAVHAICDESFLPELAREIRERVTGRHIHLVLENDDNDTKFLHSGFDAQWDDDLHHVFHVLLTGESRGYYEDYANDSSAKLVRGLMEGFVYQGEPASSRGGASRGHPATGLTATSFVSFLQNHDQIGNRAFGERLTVLTDPKKLEALTALQLLAPQIPLIFMGEESGAAEPFLYFTDHQDEQLAAAVRDGRRREFARFPEFSDQQKRAQIPDLNDEGTFHRSRPSFNSNERTFLYRRLLELRRKWLVPRLKGIRAQGGEVIGPKAVVAKWRFQDGGLLTIASNLGDATALAVMPDTQPIWGSRLDKELPPAETAVWIENP